MAYFVLCVKEQSVTLVTQYFVTAVNLAHQNRCSGVNIPQFELLSYDSEPWFCPKCINTSLPFSTEENVGEPDEVPRQLNDENKLLIFDLNKVSNGNADKNFEPTFDTTNCK